MMHGANDSFECHLDTRKYRIHLCVIDCGLEHLIYENRVTATFQSLQLQSHQEDAQTMKT